MANIFLSYNSADRHVARRIADSFTHVGVTVWWDDRLTPTEQWDRLIEKEIRQANVVVVLWTPRAVESDWVRAEANYARSNKKLLQARLENCEVPLQFTLFQWYDLDDWIAGNGDEKWQKLLTGFRSFAPTLPDAFGAPAPSSTPEPAPVPSANEFAQTLVELARKAAASGSGMYDDVAIPSLSYSWPEFISDYQLNYSAITSEMTKSLLPPAKVFEAAVNLSLYFMKARNENESYRALQLGLEALKAVKSKELKQFVPALRAFAKFAIHDLDPGDMSLYAIGRMLGATASYMAGTAPASVIRQWLAATIAVLSAYGENSKDLAAGFRERSGQAAYQVEIMTFDQPRVGAMIISVLLAAEEDEEFHAIALKRIEAQRSVTTPAG